MLKLTERRFEFTSKFFLSRFINFTVLYKLCLAKPTNREVIITDSRHQETDGVRCLEPIVKHEAQVFDISSKKLCNDMFSQIKQWWIVRCYIFALHWRKVFTSYMFTSWFSLYVSIIRFHLVSSHADWSISVISKYFI